MKNNTITVLLALLAFSFCISSYGQDWNWQALSEKSNRIQGKLSGKVYYMPPEGGSEHFYHDSWPEGSILMEDGDVFENQRLRYLALGDELVAYNSGLSQLFIVDKEKVAGFTVNLPEEKQTFVKMYFDGFMSGYRYFEMLYDGNRKLLAFHSVDNVKTGIYNDKQGRIKHSVLKLNTGYYMYSEKTGFKRIQPRRSSFLHAFPGHKKEVRRIFRKNNFYRLTKQEMIQAFNLLAEAGILL
ncbi:MAG: hypothetical protein ACOC0R_05675 [Mariniphaga sp.]